MDGGPGSAERRSGAREEAGAPARVPALGLVDWNHSPYRTFTVWAALSALLWLVALGPCRSLCVLCLLLVLGLLTHCVCDTGRLWTGGVALWWRRMHSEQDSSLQLLLKETCAFRQQNPGKFCLLMCSVCTFVAVLGRYIPGVVLSYALILWIFLWPLLSSLDLFLWLEPVLHRMDEGLWSIVHKIRDGQGCVAQSPLSHTDAAPVDSDLSSLTSKLDSALRKELCVSDTEPSDLSWTEGAFNQTEEHTPSTDQSQGELDKEGITDYLPEISFLDSGDHMTDSTSDEEGLYPAIPAPLPHQSITTLHSSVTELECQLVSALLQERLHSALAPASAPTSVPVLPGQEDSGLEQAEEWDSDMEDFELLDRSELERCEAEFGLDLGQDLVPERSPEPSHRHTVTGFFSRLLRRK